MTSLPNQPRLPGGLPSGGQFTVSARDEGRLSLVAEQPDFPDIPGLAGQWPNRAQRCDVVNRHLYAIASHRGVSDFDRVKAGRQAVKYTHESLGGFLSVPGAEDEVLVALVSDRRLMDAIDRVGDLGDAESQTFGNRIAGAIYDIREEEDEARRVAELPLATDDVADRWPDWLPAEPPTEDQVLTTW